MKKLLIVSELCSLLAFSGCGTAPIAEVYAVPVDPYHPVNEEDVRIGECTISIGDEVSINGQGAWFGKDDDILISKGGTYTISGSYTGGCITVDTDDIVKLVFSNAAISNDSGYAVVSSADKLILCSDGESSLTGSGGDYGNAVFSYGSVIISGAGSLNIDGGIFSCGGIRFGRNVSTLCEILELDSGEMIPGTLTIN